MIQKRSPIPGEMWRWFRSALEKELRTRDGLDFRILDAGAGAFGVEIDGVPTWINVLHPGQVKVEGCPRFDGCRRGLAPAHFQVAFRTELNVMRIIDRILVVSEALRKREDALEAEDTVKEAEPETDAEKIERLEAELEGVKGELAQVKRSLEKWRNGSLP